MDELQSKTNLDELKTLYAISDIAASAQDLPGLWGPLLDKVLEVLRVDAGSLMTLEGDFLVRKAARGFEAGILEEPPIPSSEGGISWRVVETRHPQVVTDLTKEKIASKYIAGAGFHSLVAVPMMVREQVLGVLTIFTHKERQFSPDDLKFFTIIANQAALAIISIRSVEILNENRRRLSELEALNQISKGISTLFDFEETLFSIVTSITKTLRGDAGAIILFDHKDHLLKAVSPAYGLDQNQVRDFRTRNDEGITGEAFCKGVPIMMGELDNPTLATLERAKITGVKSIIAAPLKVKSQSMGVLQILSKNSHNFRNDDLRLFTILSAQAAIVVNSAAMYREIEKERKKDEALLTSIGEGVVAIDQDQKIIHLNRAGEKITGYLAEEILGQNFIDTLGLYNRESQPIESSSTPITQVLKNGQSLAGKDYFIKKRHGNLFPAYITFSAVRDGDNKITGAIIIFRDVTYEMQLDQMKEELISISTHELRAPITAIKGYLDMILTGDTGHIGPETRETIEEMVKINQQLADLVDDLLNVGRIEQGRMQIVPIPIKLEDSIKQVTKQYELLAEGKGLKLIYEHVALPDIKADPERLRQILSNLISNAIKYTKNGQIEVTAYPKDGQVVCEVKDTGIGISGADQKQLFEKFYRVRTEKNREIAGTGLGLWITKKLVEMMGGKIWLDSVEDKGTSFYFTLPLA